MTADGLTHMCMRRVALIALAAVLACLAFATPGEAATRPLTTGFTDPVLQQGSPLSDPWLQRAKSAGAGVVLLGLAWSDVASSRPANPEDPNDPAYNWTATDAAVRGVAANGLTIAMNVIYAPAWAEGPGRPVDAPPGTWRPDAHAFGAFMTAAARRYSGTFATPAGVLPRVRNWQPWSEPNLDNHISPQWTRRNGRSVPESPTIYRGLLNAAYAAVKGVHASNLVITGATSPFGDRDPTRGRVPPALFVRELLCITGQALRVVNCPSPARFDILSHHPYSVGPPRRRALNTDDVSLPDLGKLTRILRVAERTGRALPAGRKRLWVTEFSYDSKPPDPEGVPSERHARWTAEGLFLLWRQGVDTVTWYIIRDQAPIPSYAATYQSGLFRNDGAPKMALRAFRFPFVTERIKGRRVLAWAKSPAAGQLKMQRRTRSGSWTTVYSKRVRRGETVEKRLSLRGATSLRARIGSETSIVWRQS